MDTLERDDTKILICFAKDKNDLWSEVFGSGWEHSPWWVDIDLGEGGWEKHGTAVIEYLNPDDPEEVKALTKTITVVDLANAVSALTEIGWTHCGGNAIHDSDWCTSDAVLQFAVFGEFIYG
jgi:hypothetical protein